MISFEKVLLLSIYITVIFIVTFLLGCYIGDYIKTML